MTKGYSCKNCNQKDNDHMVQCDTCDQWFHYVCVGVNNEIANISWNCNNCEPAQPAITATSTSAPPIERNDTSTTISGQPQASSSPGLRPSEIVSSQALNNASQQPTDVPTSSLVSSVIVSIGATMGSTVVTSTAHHAIPAILPPTTMFLPGNLVGTHRNILNAPTTPSVANKQHVGQHLAPPPTCKPATLFMDNEQFVGQHSLPPSGGLAPLYTTMGQHVAQYTIPQLELLEEEKKIEQKYLQRKFELLSQSGVSLNGNNLNITTPTPSQLAARQVIPKDLPSFHGNPDDWPLFISNYENSTEVAGYTNAENLMRLQKSLKGKALEMVRCKLLLPSMVPEIIQTLRMCFGRPEHILDSLIEKARRIPPPKERLECLIDFALCVRNICSTMEACHMQAHLNNPMLVQEFVDKLPNQHKLNWAMQLRDERVPAIKAFSDWIFSIAEAASKVVSPCVSKKSASINTHTQAVPKPNHSKALCFACKSGQHKIQNCEEFKNLSLERKWNVVKDNRLCRQCLNAHRRKCAFNRECGIDDCKSKHHTLLHKSTLSVSNAPQAALVATNKQLVNTHTDIDEEVSCCFRIIPVRVYSKNKSMLTFAFLDEGSSVTLMEQHIYDSLNLCGEREALCLRWTGDNTRIENNSVRTSVEISNAYQGVKYNISEVHTVQKLGLPSQSLNMDKMLKKYPYLNGLPIRSYENVRPSILIGANCWKVAVPTKTREGGWLEPIATKCRLGWALQGNVGTNPAERQLNVHLCDCQTKYESLHEEVKEYFNLESSLGKRLLSSEDERALQILNSTCRKNNSHYELGLLWKQDVKELPDSYDNALKRFTCMQKKLAKDADLRRSMQGQINNLLAKGYAKKLSPDEMYISTDRVWYLPIFIALNPNKPGKVRLVWDAAAKSNGVALNDLVVSGPDLLNSLTDVLIAFRTEQVAICGDIAEMFHQIKVRDADMHAQRFLWSDNHEDPDVYVMKALTFGISCAPCIAHFVRDINAKKYEDTLPRAVESIQKFHYVDDFIDSVDTPEEAVQLASQVKSIHANAGFHIRNWTSNSPIVLKELGDEAAATQSPKGMGHTEKILGLFWDPNDDVFKFICRFSKMRRDILLSELVPTKREVLQTLMSIFDPLGFLANYTIGLKILLQEVWRSCIGWDDPLPSQLYNQWCRWKTLLSAISSTTIPRCYSPLLTKSTCNQLHTFVDAGEYAYSAICYIRTQLGGKVETIIVAAKSKVAPLKPVSIPRLELQAAVIGVRLATSVTAAMRVPIHGRFWWSDSKTVLKWLRMDPRSFKQYVMHRVGEVLETTNATDWRWVPTKLNPADLATKFTVQHSSEFWLYGPKFLSLDQSEWPICGDLGSAERTELRHCVLHTTKYTPAQPILKVEDFSTWRRLYRVMMTVIKFIAKLKAATNKSMVPLEDYETAQKAKNVLISEAQQSEYYQEIQTLMAGKIIEKDSKLISLNTYIDGDNILRTRGRAESLGSGNAIILPYKHHVAFLIVNHYHLKNHHQFHEATINSIREKYYIPRLRVLYRKVRRQCQRCKNDSAKPNTQQMAPLPAARLASFERPFTFVGIDLFGPLYVSVGRRREKRWGVIFTCLSVRAVHLEIAHSLDVSSCILCIQNFISRRGRPREIYTDNGTNFKAAEKALSPESAIITSARSKYDDIKWRFNPPAAPHMGGAWERLVRSVKAVLNAICPSFKFNDETLKSALCEVELIINSRPLTFVSLDNADDDALTPNHLLLGSTDGHKPAFDENYDLRQRWHRTQEFANKFWQRWMREYVPILQRRVKWFNKRPSVQVGDVVVITDEALPRNSWPKGIITEVVETKDGQVRRVTIKTQKATLQRPITKVAVLDVNAD